MANQRVSVLRHVIGVITAVVLAPVGVGVLWYGSGLAYGNATHGSTSITGILLAIVGIALLLVVVQTGHVSSVGLTVVAIAVGAFGLVTFLARDTTSDIIFWLRGFNPELVVGGGLWMLRGGMLALGLMLAAVALSSSLARRPTDVSSSPFIRNVLSILLAVVAAVVGLAFLASGEPVRGVVGAVLVGVVILTTSISSAGAFVTGAIALVLGMLGFWFPAVATALANPFDPFGPAERAQLPVLYLIGFIATFGAVTLGSALVVQSVRTRSARRASTV